MTKKIVLTVPQRKVLELLSEKDARAFYMPALGRFRENAYWFLSNGPHCTKQIEKLLSLALVEQRKKSVFDDPQAFITTAGREYLKSKKK